MILIAPSCINVLTEMFDKTRMAGALLPIAGTDPRLGPWEHVAFRGSSAP